MLLVADARDIHITTEKISKRFESISNVNIEFDDMPELKEDFNELN